MTFTQVKDKDTGMLIDAKYGYVETPGMGGNFQFTLTKDAILTTPALETLTVRSRWQETGAGRSDVKFVGGDLLTTEATANEWCSNFLIVFLTNSYGDPQDVGRRTVRCRFQTPATQCSMLIITCPGRRVEVIRVPRGRASAPLPARPANFGVRRSDASGVDARSSRAGATCWASFTASWRHCVWPLFYLLKAGRQRRLRADVIAQALITCGIPLRGIALPG